MDQIDLVNVDLEKAQAEICDFRCDDCPLLQLCLLDVCGV